MVDHAAVVPEPGPSRSDSTEVLLTRVRTGDRGARAVLLQRYLPALHRIAHGRLPARARGFADTNDLVQTTVLKALGRLEHFEYRGEGAFLAYLRQILVNQIRDQTRRAENRGDHAQLNEGLVHPDATPLQQAIGNDMLAAYDAALSRLRSRQRQALILRIEFGFDYAQMAEALGCSTSNAARLLLMRALVQLAARLRKLGHVA